MHMSQLCTGSLCVGAVKMREFIWRSLQIADNASGGFDAYAWLVRFTLKIDAAGRRKPNQNCEHF